MAPHNLHFSDCLIITGFVGGMVSMSGGFRSLSWKVISAPQLLHFTIQR
jgi:hypothetical protein